MPSKKVRQAASAARTRGPNARGQNPTRDPLVTDERLIKEAGLVPKALTLEEMTYQRLFRFCRWQCTKVEVLDILGMTREALDNLLKKRGWASWSEFYAAKSAAGKASMRRAQYISATIDRNPTLLVWMGKQHLGQADRREQMIEMQKSVRFDPAKLTDDQIDQILDGAEIIEGDFEDVTE